MSNTEKAKLMRKVLGYLSASLLLTWSVFFPGVSPSQLASKYRCASIVSQSVWTKEMSQAYARVLAADKYGWNKYEYAALDKLWEAESHWNPLAINKSKDVYSGEKAGGIPQMLGMSTDTPAPLQIERGLAYIAARYNKPSTAWAHHRARGWY